MVEPVADIEEQPSEDEGVVLSWLGRRKARVGIPKPRFLEEVPEHSDPSPGDPGNLLIEGDNRQAMVSLLAQYGGKVDVVLIDPPYNTGKNDFRYDDARFQDPDAEPRRGDFVSAEDGGRHTKWLNQMAPTLRIIQDLMAPHGVIFVHINDIELPRLLMLMEDIFDERNKVGTLIWKSATDNNPSRIVTEHEYIVVWAKNRAATPTPWRGQFEQRRQLLVDEWERIQTLAADARQRETEWFAYLTANKKILGSFATNYRHIDARAPFMTSDLSFPGGGGPSYEVLHPETKKPTRVPPHGYRVKADRMAEYQREDRLHFGKDETSSVLYKRYITDAEDDPLRSVIAEFGGKGVNATIKRLFPEDPDIFPNPKPVELEEYVLSFVARRDAIILDAFAGSGTTGHAAMRLNKKDGGSRRFILIEEGNEGDRYATSVTGERLRRARELEKLPGGFTFLRVGSKIDLAAFASFKRKQLAETILQTDASGRGGGIKSIEGQTHVIGRNARNEAICLYYDADGHGPITAEILGQMYSEADALGLARPLRVYGEACELFGSDSFKFFKLPQELANNLTVALRGSK
jgi:adenine-specific DNA-methyltransferase